ncbi:23S rRNA (adenine(1618)-N(6))-methyltransferase RlmF [Reinekea marina]|uniref:Ribosomal RNA large subunit methyltransferase F n=1 Tax=Reinekea marina TaxID=1310421 RepID=A0ABV7WUB1_9GAMM|nr:23S rRNA (adenine(1618)-N(6))-methyltransferase RlmF [Reinekea marina]MDN3650246.1 23S rRNA (adenine(1618)-N(6))-methyltransferase RlmF [Reinekea marina]
MPKPNSRNAPAVAKLHPRNPHQGRYNFDVLLKTTPELSEFVIKNPSGQKTIDFSSQRAVVALNKALLSYFYSVKNWQLPKGFLCPPIPGRADYIHYAADLLADMNNRKVPKGTQVKVVDIGTGANLVYPIIGSSSYGWHFTASEVNEASYVAAKENIERNESLRNAINLVKQTEPKSIFKGVIVRNERISLTLCNPPFHASAKVANAGSHRKNLNLSKQAKTTNKKDTKPTLNFGGQHNELWCDGGELAFIKTMIRESKEFAEQVAWFSSLISKKENLNPIKLALKKTGAIEVKVVKMAQGQKISRFVAWTFVAEDRRRRWFDD